MKKINKLKNEKAISASIVLLVLSTVVLTTTGLTYYINKDNSIKENVRVSGDIDEVSLRKDLLDFYLEDVFDKSTDIFTIGTASSIGFIERFRGELVKLKDKEGFYPIEELNIIEERMLDDNIINNVEVIDNRLIFKLEISLEKGYSREDSRISLNYNYIKEFESVSKK